MRRWRHAARAALMGTLLAVLATSCAYYNTFYLARRYYQRSLNDVPYALDKSDLSGQSQFPKAIDLSRKLIDQYPKSKWVDDAYVLWAKSLIGNDDPREAMRMLQEFPTLYPKSSASGEATFYLGVAYLRSRKYERALETLDRFLAEAPRKDLEPYAHLERSRALLALDRPAEAAQAAGWVVQKVKRGQLGTRARIARAEALIVQRDFDAAREDFRTLGRRAASDEDRLTYLLRESDCLEGARKFDEALALLRDAIAHEREPVRADTTGGRITTGPTTPEAQRYGRLLMRIGTVQLRAGRLDEALAAYRRVLQDYPRTPLGGEAQYRIGYAYETVGDDFDRARDEYGRVREQAAGSSFAEQATARLGSLEQLAQFRKASGDSVQRAAEAEFLLAEQYLFQLDKPERALEEYRKIAHTFAGTPYEPKAINAQAWVLSRRLKQRAVADSLFWVVVRQHAGTEAQLAARDYLEAGGVAVPAELIRLPERVLTHADSVAADSILRADSLKAVADTARALAPPAPGAGTLVAPPPPGAADSLRLGPRGGPFSMPPIAVPPDTSRRIVPPNVAPAPVAPARSDTTRRTAPAPADTVRRPLPPGPVAPPRDTTRKTSG